MQEFEKQSEIMDMKEEMMSDAIDDAMGDEGDEEERLNWKIIKSMESFSNFKLSLVMRSYHRSWMNSDFS